MSQRITTVAEIDSLRTGLSDAQKETAFISYGRAFEAFRIAGADDSKSHDRASAIALSRIDIRDRLETVSDSLYDGKWPSPGKGAPRNPYGGLAAFEYPGGAEGWQNAWTVYLASISDTKIFLGIMEWIWAVVDALEYNLDWSAIDSDKISFRKGDLPEATIHSTASDYGESAWKDRGESLSLEKVNFPSMADISSLYSIYWAERKRKEVDGLFSTEDSADLPATGIRNDSGAELRYGAPSKMVVVSHDAELGILVTDTPILRFAPLPYKTADGSIEWVAKKPEDFATADFLSQIPGKPIADLHPPAHFDPYPGADHLPTLTEAEGIKRTVGIHDFDPKNVRVDLDAGTIVARTIYFEDSTIRGILDGSKAEVSVGIYAFNEAEEGELSGSKYTKKQTAPVYDHLAVVPRGRCGPTCSVPVSDAELGKSINQGGENMPKKETDKSVTDPRILSILADAEGAEATTIVLCPDVTEDSATSFQARIDAIIAERDSGAVALETLKAELAKVKGERDGANDGLKAVQARLDALENAKPVIDADQLFDDRLDMVNWMKENVTVKDAEGVEAPYVHRGKTIIQMRRDALESFLGEDEASRIKDESDDYVRARFDSLKERVDSGKALPVGSRNLRSSHDNHEPAPGHDTSRTLDLHRNGARATKSAEKE